MFRFQSVCGYVRTERRLQKSEQRGHSPGRKENKKFLIKITRIKECSKSELIDVVIYWKRRIIGIACTMVDSVSAGKMFYCRKYQLAIPIREECQNYGKSLKSAMAKSFERGCQNAALGGSQYAWWRSITWHLERPGQIRLVKICWALRQGWIEGRRYRVPSSSKFSSTALAVITKCRLGFPAPTREYQTPNRFPLLFRFGSGIMQAAFDDRLGVHEIDIALYARVCTNSQWCFRWENLPILTDASWDAGSAYRRFAEYEGIQYALGSMPQELMGGQNYGHYKRNCLYRNNALWSSISWVSGKSNSWDRE